MPRNKKAERRKCYIRCRGGKPRAYGQFQDARVAPIRSMARNAVEQSVGKVFVRKETSQAQCSGIFAMMAATIQAPPCRHRCHRGEET